MKIVITYASAGTGHNRAAQAIYSHLREYHKEIDVKIIDVLKKTNILFGLSYYYGYLFLVKYAPFLWWLGFWSTYAKVLRPFNKPIVLIINRLSTRKFSKFLIQENPDFIISTHFLPSEISVYLKRTQKIKSRIFTVITDFGVHPFWIADGTDIYNVALDSTKEKLISEGIKENNIKEFGIPIDSKFLRRYEKDVLTKKFDIDQNKFTVLITTGSFGIGPIEEIVDLLYKDIQILVVCANNKRLYTRLKNKNYPDVRVFGFIDNIQELMSVSDIIITKPGGLTISESLTMDLVPIFIAAIPGQETENIKILTKKGIGIKARNTASIKDIILDFKNRPDKLKSIKENISRIKKPFATRELCNAVCQGSIGDTC